ncbi:hypothetical protein [Pyrococcus sp. ST04]|uniref:hypothetical protein n=1 Tax=Pyrococcus sp. ST04 TaxID=1183377 RepID=UPI0002605CF2|nr:hypothetical protein [Pyrococcus sp. ST04]AFK22436.1 hypothetical protein Py04_0844 [Pyrococcus sp. ST04]
MSIKEAWKVLNDKNKAVEIVIIILETLFIMWFTTAFLYQNYLLYKWHRGLPLPSKFPFLVVGISGGLAFFLYRMDNLIKASRENKIGVADGGSREDTSDNQA